MTLLQIDYLNATVSVLAPATISAIVIGIYKVAEFNEHKKTASQWMDDATKKMDRHELNDENRQLEVIRRMEQMEKNLLDTWKEIAKK